MTAHCCTEMRRHVDEFGGDPAGTYHPVQYSQRWNTYALFIPDDPYGRTVPIDFCPWCATQLRRIRSSGLERMTPEICRQARGLMSMSYRQLAEEANADVAAVFRYEQGKPTDDALVERLLDLFQGVPMWVDAKSGRVGWIIR